MKNYYQILGVDPQASSSEIKKAYRLLAQRYHPDSGNPQTNAKFQELTEAYKCLLDKEKRKRHDLELWEQKQKSASSYPLAPQTGLYQKRIRPKRDKILKRFRQKNFLVGIFKVILITLLFFGLGFLMAWALEGYRWPGGILAGLSGLFLGVRRNFEVESFFSTQKSQKVFKWIGWGVDALVVSYFGILGMMKILV